MRFWQKAMISFATHHTRKVWIQNTLVATFLARRSVGGENEAAAVATGLAPLWKIADQNQILSGQYEFEILFGVWPKLQQELVQKGCRLRIYLPYDKYFWPYAVRRIGENPKNIKFLITSFL